MPSRRGLLILVLLLSMEVLAGFTVVVGSSILDATSMKYSMFWLLLVSGLGGVIAGVAVAAGELRDPWNRVALLSAGGLAVGVPAALTSRGWVSILAASLILAVAYWRGLALTQEPPSHEAVRRRFGLGFAILFFGIAWVVARGIVFQRPIWTMLALVGIAYTVAAMLALSAARIEETREPGAGAAVVLAVAAQLGVLVVLGLVAIEFFALDIGGWVGHLTQPFWNVIGLILRAILLLLVTPVAWLIEALRVHAHHPYVLHAQPPGAAHGNGRRLKAHPTDSPWVAALGAAIVLLILAGIGALIWRTLPRLQRRRKDRGYKEERQALWSLPALWQALRVWLRSLFGRGAGATRQAMTAVRHRVWGPLYPADPVRRLYAQILRRAQVNGLTRPPQETPAEFERRLAERWPEGSPDFDALTGAYVRRRYGDLPFEDEEITGLRWHWQQARNLMRASRRADKGEE